MKANIKRYIKQRIAVEALALLFFLTREYKDCWPARLFRKGRRAR